MPDTITHNGVAYKLTRLTSARDAAKAANRIRPWLSRSEEQLLQAEHIARVRRENGIPSPDEWMW